MNLFETVPYIRYRPRGLYRMYGTVSNKFMHYWSLNKYLPSIFNFNPFVSDPLRIRKALTAKEKGEEHRPIREFTTNAYLTLGK